VLHVEKTILQKYVCLLILIMHFICNLFLAFFILPLSWLSNPDVPALRDNIIQVYNKYGAEKYLERKSYELDINANGFIRYKRVWKNNKSEYFSVKIEKVKDINFLGSEKGGWLSLICEPETVIYQTHRDPSGNVDSMTNEISFPLSAISEDELNLFAKNFKSLKELVAKKIEN